MKGSEMRKARLPLLCGVLAVCCASPALAQAWLPPKGEASLALGYGNIFVNRHYLGTSANPGDNVENDFGHIRSQSIQIALGYGLSDRLAISASLPYILTKYYGTPGQNFFPHTISIDDGRYHGIFQDFRVDLDYQLLREPVAVAPFFAAVIPSHSYTYFAHAAGGRALHEYLLGSSFGARLDQLLAGSYVELTYSYAFVERVLDIHHDRSNGFLELGYFLTPSLSARGIATGFYTHGGVNGLAADRLPPPQIFLHHDQIGHESGISVGGGLSYVLTGSTEVYASYLTQVQGRGGHKIKDSLSFGVTYNFSPSQLVRRFLPAKSDKGSAP
jgi:hypothetical protein